MKIFNDYKNKIKSYLGDRMLSMPFSLGKVAMLNINGKYIYLWQDAKGQVCYSFDIYDKEYRHEISIIKGTKLFDLVKKEKYNVNSIHSMIAPKGNVEKYARISAISYDNLVESFELDNKKFVMGIKWHPELMLEDEFSDKLFKKFISKC